MPGAKALTGSFAMSKFAGDSAHGKVPGKRPFAKAFCILSGLLPLAKCNISCSVRAEKATWEEEADLRCQVPKLRLEDKFVFQDGGNVRIQHKVAF